MKTEVVQDISREISLREMCGLLDSNQGRMGTDAIDVFGNEFELKSGTKKSGFSTARDFGIHTIERWKDKHWVFGHGKNYKTGFKFEMVFYLSPSMIGGWFDEIRSKLEVYHSIANRAYESFECDDSSKEILSTILKRGCTLNDPKIPMKYIQSRGVLLGEPYPESLLAAINNEPQGKFIKPYGTLEEFFT